MAKRTQITYECNLILQDGTVKPISEITADERELWQRGMTERLSRNLSGYYAEHLKEYARLESRA